MFQLKSCRMKEKKALLECRNGKILQKKALHKCEIII